MARSHSRAPVSTALQEEGSQGFFFLLLLGGGIQKMGFGVLRVNSWRSVREWRVAVAEVLSSIGSEEKEAKRDWRW